MLCSVPRTSSAVLGSTAPELEVISVLNQAWSYTILHLGTTFSCWSYSGHEHKCRLLQWYIITIQWSVTYAIFSPTKQVFFLVFKETFLFVQQIQIWTGLGLHKLHYSASHEHSVQNAFCSKWHQRSAQKCFKSPSEQQECVFLCILNIM